MVQLKIALDPLAFSACVHLFLWPLTLCEHIPVYKLFLCRGMSGIFYDILILLIITVFMFEYDKCWVGQLLMGFHDVVFLPS